MLLRARKVVSFILKFGILLNISACMKSWLSDLAWGNGRGTTRRLCTSVAESSTTQAGHMHCLLDVFSNHTLTETNIAAENRVSQKENSSCNHWLSGDMLVVGSIYSLLCSVDNGSDQNWAVETTGQPGILWLIGFDHA